MKIPSAPKFPVWLIGMILGIAGIVGRFVVIDYVSKYSFLLVTAGFVLLALGTLLRKF